MTESESFDIFLPFLLSFTVPEVSLLYSILCLIASIIIPGLGTLIAALIHRESRYFVFFAVTAAIQFVATIIVVGYIYSLAFAICMIIWPEGKADSRPKRMWPESGPPAEVLEEARKKKEEKEKAGGEKKDEEKKEEGDKEEAPAEAPKAESPDSPAEAGAAQPDVHEELHEVQQKQTGSAAGEPVPPIF